MFIFKKKTPPFCIAKRYRESFEIALIYFSSTRLCKERYWWIVYELIISFNPLQETKPDLALWRNQTGFLNILFEKYTCLNIFVRIFWKLFSKFLKKTWVFSKVRLLLMQLSNNTCYSKTCIQLCILVLAVICHKLWKPVNHLVMRTIETRSSPPS